MKTVKEVMRTQVPTISPSESLKKATEVMKHEKTGGLAVMDGGRLVGIITDGDILNAFYLNVSAFSYEEKLEGSHNGAFKKRVEEFRNTTVGEVMTPHPRTISENATVDEAASIIKRFKIKRVIAVNNNGEPVGMVERLNVVDSILGV